MTCVPKNLGVNTFPDLSGVAGGEQVTRGAARLVFEAVFIFEVVFIFDGDKAVELFVRLT